MDLLDKTYNKLECLAVSADEWLTAALRQWQSWPTFRKLAALNERQLKDVGLSRVELERNAPGEIVAGRSAEEGRYATDPNGREIRAA